MDGGCRCGSVPLSARAYNGLRWRRPPLPARRPAAPRWRLGGHTGGAHAADAPPEQARLDRGARPRSSGGSSGNAGGRVPLRRRAAPATQRRGRGEGQGAPLPTWRQPPAGVCAATPPRRRPPAGHANGRRACGGEGRGGRRREAVVVADDGAPPCVKNSPAFGWTTKNRREEDDLDESERNIFENESTPCVRVPVRIGQSWTSCNISSLDEAAQQTAEQNCLFGNRQTDADLLARLFGQQTPNRTSFCSEPLLTSLVGGPYIFQALLIVTAPMQGLMKNLGTGHVSMQHKHATVN